MDEIQFDRLINIQSYSDEELKELIEQLGKQEAELSKRRRLLHGEIDILKAERSRRGRDRQKAGESLIADGGLEVLTTILTGRPSSKSPEEQSEDPVARREDAMVRSIQRRFRDLSVDERKERVIRYIVKQVRLGRHVDDVMADEYVSEHTSQVDRDMLLQNPTVLHAIEEEILQQFADYGADVIPKDTGDAPR